MLQHSNLLRNCGLFLTMALAACSATVPESPTLPPVENSPPVSSPGTGTDLVIPPNARDTLPSSPTRLNYVAQGLASWYPAYNHGVKTASGEIYDLYGMTAAHATLPLLSWVSVRNLETGEKVIVKINDRLVSNESLIQLSYEAAQRLNLFKQNSYVEVIGIVAPRSRLSEQEYSQIADYKPINE